MHYRQTADTGAKVRRNAGGEPRASIHPSSLPFPPFYALLAFCISEVEQCGTSRMFLNTFQIGKNPDPDWRLRRRAPHRPTSGCSTVTYARRALRHSTLNRLLACDLDCRGRVRVDVNLPRD